ncbi:hypothetical protein KCU83_g500, partial [Aureobasidium melanogenum]
MVTGPPLASSSILRKSMGSVFAEKRAKRGCHQSFFNLRQSDVSAIARTVCVSDGHSWNFPSNEQITLVCQSVQAWTGATVGDFASCVVMITAFRIGECIVVSSWNTTAQKTFGKICESKIHFSEIGSRNNFENEENALCSTRIFESNNILTSGMDFAQLLRAELIPWWHHGILNISLSSTILVETQPCASLHVVTKPQIPRTATSKWGISSSPEAAENCMNTSSDDKA